MKQWTTPTLPVTITTGLIESCDCDVNSAVIFAAQNVCAHVTTNYLTTK